MLERSFIEQIIAEQRLPTAHEQADNLIRHIGEQLELRQEPGGEAPFVPEQLVSIVGCQNERGIWYLVDELDRAGFLSFPGTLTPSALKDPGRQPPSDRTPTISSVRLTFAGWTRFDQLQRAHSEGPIAFMAMPFGDPVLEHLFSNCFKPAVSATGFDLRRIIDNPPAGIIDDRLRVEIRKSRFMVCELTKRNPGAYWEAGFAEGLGRPVVYTCEKSYFQRQGTHFDTNHCHTILWIEQDLPDAAERLKATIRATLPGEAKLTD